MAGGDPADDPALAFDEQLAPRLLAARLFLRGLGDGPRRIHGPRRPPSASARPDALGGSRERRVSGVAARTTPRIRADSAAVSAGREKRDITCLIWPAAKLSGGRVVCLCYNSPSTVLFLCDGALYFGGETEPARLRRTAGRR